MQLIKVSCIALIVALFVSQAWASDDTSDSSSGSSGFVQQANKKTQKGLKTFKKLYKEDSDQAKQDFQKSVGQDPNDDASEALKEDKESNPFDFDQHSSTIQ